MVYVLALRLSTQSLAWERSQHLVLSLQDGLREMVTVSNTPVFGAEL